MRWTVFDLRPHTSIPFQPSTGSKNQAQKQHLFLLVIAGGAVSASAPCISPALCVNRKRGDVQLGSDSPAQKLLLPLSREWRSLGE